MLDYLSVTENWGEFECALNQHVIRVYLKRAWRALMLTAAAFVTPEGLFQFGHSKDYRPDLPQLKIAMAVLDPLGLPLTTTVVAGNTADDPLYLPEIAKVRKIIALTGLTYVGVARWRRWGLPAVVAHQDYRVSALGKQMPATELDRLLERVWSGAQALVAVRRPRTADPTRG